jgi:glutaredoxin
MIELRILTRRDCGLCDEMKAIAECFVVSGEASLQAVDVDSDPELAARYGNEVPVLFVNGRRAFKYRVTGAELRRRLAAERRRATADRLRRLVGWQRSGDRASRGGGGDRKK